MLNPIDPSAVKEICATKFTEDEIEPYVKDAHTLLTRLYAAETITDADWALVERWLAAHYCWCNDETLRITSESTNGASASLEGEKRFLEQAFAFDPTGKLRSYFKPTGFVPIFRTAQTTR